MIRVSLLALAWLAGASAAPARELRLVLFLYPVFAKSFRLGSRPLGERYQVLFGDSSEGLSLPTEARHETILAVGARDYRPIEVTTRRYDLYRVFETSTREKIGRVAP